MGIRHLTLPFLFVVSFFTLLTVGYAYTQLQQNVSSGRHIQPLQQLAEGVNDTQPSRSQVLGKTQGSAWFSKSEDYYTGHSLLSLSAAEEPVVYLSERDTTGPFTVSLYPITEADVLGLFLRNDQNKFYQESLDLSNRQATATQVVEPKDGKVAVPLPLSESGLWYVQAQGEEVIARAILVRSKNGTLVKTGDGEFIYWSQDFKTHKAVPDITITQYSLKGEMVAVGSGVTDASGLLKLPYVITADLAIAKVGDDIAVVPINLQNTTYMDWSQFQAQRTAKRTFFFTDRALYQPGDAVNYKAVIRDDSDGRFSLPQGNVYVKVSKGDQYDQTLITKQETVNEFGSIDGSFTLPQDASPGYYNMRLAFQPFTPENESRYNPDDVSVGFQVEYYTKPDYHLSLAGSQLAYIKGENISALVRGEYFSGQPLANQTVKYQLKKKNYYDYEYRDSLLAADTEYQYGWWGEGDSIQGGEVKLDQKGTGILTIDTGTIAHLGEEGSDVLTLDIEYVDASGVKVKSQKNFLVFGSEYGIYRDQYSDWSSQVGAPADLSLVVLNRRTGQTVSNVPLTVTAVRTWWDPPEPMSTSQYAPAIEHTEEIPIRGVTTNEQGVGHVTFSPKKSGSYKIAVQTEDPQGNPTTRQLYWYVWGGEDWWFSSKSSQVSVIPDKKTYVPGDTAQLTIFASDMNDGDVLLSLQRGRVWSTQVVPVSQGQTVVPLELTAAYMPSITALVNSFGKQQLNTDQTELDVSANQQKMQVSLKSDKSMYGPGEIATITVKAEDGLGQPVAAEIALWVMDKALLELRDSNIYGTIFEKFWSKQYYWSPTSDSLKGISENTAERGGGGGGGDVRDTFQDIAYWNPRVKTDASGNGVIRFTVPDNLTTWVVTGIGSTQSTVVGQNSAEFKVSKDLVVRPIIPNFLRVGDRVTLASLIQNFTDQTLAVLTKMTATLGTLQPAEERTLTLEPSQLEQVEWKYEPAAEAGEVSVAMSAKATDAQQQDTVVQKLKVQPYGFTQKTSQAGVGNQEYKLQLDAGADPAQSQVTLSLSPSVLGALPSAMRYLIGYPYGCVEQTVSRFVPLILALKEPQLFAEALKDEDTDAMLQAGIDRLTKMQNQEGSWGWWFENDHDNYVSAYVVEYLLEAEKLGAKVPPEVLSQAKQYFSGLSEDTKEQRVIRRYALSLFNEKIDSMSNEMMANLTDDYLSLAVMANVRAGVTNPQLNGAALLASRATAASSAPSWTNVSGDGFYSRTATGMAIRALVSADHARDIAAEAAKYQLATRRYDYWGNTYETSQMIQGMVDLFRSGAEATPAYSYTVALDGQPIVQGTVDSPTDVIKDIAISGNKLKKTGSVLTLTKEGEGQLYSTVAQEEFISDTETPAKNQGLIVERSYVNDKGEGYSYGVGDEIAVTVTVTGDSRNNAYMVVEDPVPAGWVVINKRLKNEQGDTTHRDYYYNNDYFGWYDYGTNMEIYPDRVIMSVQGRDEVTNISEPKTRTFSYRVRALVQGTFQVPPAQASLMYTPEIYGRSAAETVTIDQQANFDPTKIKMEDVKQLIVTYKNQTLRWIGLFMAIAIFMGSIGVLAWWLKRMKARRTLRNQILDGVMTNEAPDEMIQEDLPPDALDPQS